MKILKPQLSAPLSTSANSPPYIYRIVPHVAGALAAISSDDFLRTVTTDGLRVVTSGKHVGVTCLEPGPGELKGEGKVLLTAGRDAVVKLWDGRDGGGVAVVSPGPHTKAAITSLASSKDSYMFATGMEQAHSVAAVSIWDIRRSKEPTTHYAECHNDDVTELSFSKHDPTNMLSGSTDGLVNVYDISVQDEDDALLQVINHGASIHRAGFTSSSSQSNSTGPADRLIYALSHDETFSLYPRSDSSEDDAMTADGYQDQDNAPTVFGDLRPTLECEYAVGVLTIGDAIVLAAGNHSEQRLDLVPLAKTPQWDLQLESTVRLAEAHGDEIVRTIYVDEVSNTIYTGGEDGLIKVWKPEDPFVGSENVHMQKNSGAPVKQKKKKSANRHKPY